MASEQNWLFDMIHAMNKHEKNFFVRYCKFFSDGSGGYMVLYGALEKMREYDEAKLKKKLKGKVPESRLPATRNYLKKMLLHAMQASGIEQSDDEVLNGMLHNIAFYRRKNLLALCEKEIAAAKKFVQQRELYTRFHEVAYWERTVTSSLLPMGEELEARLERQMEEEKENYSRLETEAAYHLRTVRLTRIVNRTGHGIGEPAGRTKAFLDFCSDPYFTDEWRATTIRSKIAYCNIRFVVAHHQKDHERVQHFLERRIAIMESAPAFIGNNLNMYISTLYNYLGFLSLRKDRDLFTAAMNKFREIPERFKKRIDKRHLEMIPVQALHAWIDFYTLTGNFEAITKMELHFPETYSKTNYYLMFYYAAWHKAAAAHFAVGDYKTALKFINRVIQDSAAKSFPERLMHCRILNLMIHHEMNNDATIVYETKAIHYQLKKSEQPAQLEEQVLEFIRVLQRREDGKQRKKLAAIRDRINAIASPADDQHNFFIVRWLDAKTDGVTFLEAYRGE